MVCWKKFNGVANLSKYQRLNISNRHGKMVDWSEVGLKVLCYVLTGVNSLVIEENKQLKFNNKRIN